MSKSTTSSPAPSEVTANSLVSVPNPPSDSAPPPSSTSTSTPSTSAVLPERNYSAQGNTWNRLPPAYAPNSSVPNFIRLLAGLLFLGGSIGAAVAWFYKSVVVPRLILALKARVRLFGFHRDKYLELYQAVTSFTASKSCERLGGKRAVEFRKLEKDKEELVGSFEDDKEKEEEEEETLNTEKERLLGSENEEEEQEEEKKPILPPAPELLQPLSSALRQLHTSILVDSDTSKSSPMFNSSNPSNLVQPQGQLMRSFVTFNEYLESESHSISTTVSNPYRTYGSSTVTTTATTGGGGGERKALQEATQGFKAEIRSIKGALLNRRNFVRPEVGVGV